MNAFIINNDLTATVGVSEVAFKFEYDSASGKYGYRDGADTFCPFSNTSEEFPVSALVGHTVSVSSVYSGSNIYVTVKYDEAQIGYGSYTTYSGWSMTVAQDGDYSKPWTGGYTLKAGGAYLGSSQQVYVELNGAKIVASNSGSTYAGASTSITFTK